MSTHHLHPPHADHPALRTAGQFVLLLALGALVLTAGIVVLAGPGVLASPVALAVVLALLGLWAAYGLALHRHRSDVHPEIARQRERRGF